LIAAAEEREKKGEFTKKILQSLNLAEGSTTMTKAWMSGTGGENPKGGGRGSR